MRERRPTRVWPGAVVWALAWVVGLTVATPNAQTFRSGVDAVAVDVLVTRRGRGSRD